MSVRFRLVFGLKQVHETNFLQITEYLTSSSIWYLKERRNETLKKLLKVIESVGGYLNAFTSKEHTCYYARVLDEHLELATDVLSDMVFQPVFPEKELEKERNVILEELKQAEDDPDDIIQDYFEKAIFKTHPLGMPVIGNCRINIFI